MYSTWYHSMVSGQVTTQQMSVDSVLKVVIAERVPLFILYVSKVKASMHGHNVYLFVQQMLN